MDYINYFKDVCNMLGRGHGKDGVVRSYPVRSDNLGTVFRLKCVSTITKSSRCNGDKVTVVLLSNGAVAKIGDRIVKLSDGTWEVRNGKHI